jgi:hypothetical protein
MGVYALLCLKLGGLPAQISVTGCQDRIRGSFPERTSPFSGGLLQDSEQPLYQMPLQEFSLSSPFSSFHLPLSGSFYTKPSILLIMTMRSIHTKSCQHSIPQKYSFQASKPIPGLPSVIQPPFCLDVSSLMGIHPRPSNINYCLGHSAFSREDFSPENHIGDAKPLVSTFPLLLSGESRSSTIVVRELLAEPGRKSNINPCSSLLRVSQEWIILHKRVL